MEKKAALYTCLMGHSIWWKNYIIYTYRGMFNETFYNIVRKQYINTNMGVNYS